MKDILIIFSIPLSVLYTFLYLLCVYRCFFFIDFKPLWKPARLFYTFSAIQALLKSLAFWTISLLPSPSNIENRILFIIYYSGEFLLLSIFLFVFWVAIVVCSITHQSLDHFIPEAYMIEKLESVIKVLSMIVLICGSCAILCFGLDFIDKLHINIGLMCCNFSLGLSVCFLLWWVRNLLSKNPYKSSRARSLQHQVIKVLLYWAIGRMIHGFFVLVDILDLELDPASLMSEYWSSIIELFDIIISDIICVYIILERQFFCIFYKSPTEIEVTNSFLALIHEYRSETDVSEWSTSEISKVICENLICPANLSIQRSLCSEKNKLGDLHIGACQLFPSHAVVIRRIILSDHNSYVIQDLKQEILQLQRMQNANMLPILGSVIHPPIIDIITPYITNGSLHSALHSKNIIFSIKEKLRICRELAGVIRDLHINGVVHGHLTSHNVMLSGEWKILLGDVGLNQFRKFAGLTVGYCNKSAWSSPEQLKCSAGVVVNPIFTDDVYSFGMILWEVFTQKQPYRGFEWKKLRRIVIGGYTPGVPRNFKDSIKELLMMCWSGDPLLRPSFTKIAYIINKIDAND